MTPAEARKAVEPLQEALNELNKVRSTLQLVLTNASAMPPEVAEAGLEFHSQMLEAVQAGLKAVADGQAALTAREET